MSNAITSGELTGTALIRSLFVIADAAANDFAKMSFDEAWDDAHKPRRCDFEFAGACSGRCSKKLRPSEYPEVTMCPYHQAIHGEPHNWDVCANCGHPYVAHSQAPFRGLTIWGEFWSWQNEACPIGHTPFSQTQVFKSKEKL